MKDGFLKVSSVCVEIKVADCDFNAIQIIDKAIEAEKNGSKVVVFQELGITGYTCSDLFLQHSLLVGAQQALEKIIKQTKKLNALLVVGVPVSFKGKLYNCGAVIFKGILLGLVAKSFIPNYSEFYELRHFTPIENNNEIVFAGQKTIIGNKILFENSLDKRLTLAVEICEDLWVANPPSTNHCLNGATIVANLSASDEIIGKGDYRKMIVATQSAKCACGYIYSDAGFGESTTDLVFAGHNLIAENGTILSESNFFEEGITSSEIDLDKLDFERRRMNTFSSQTLNNDYITVAFEMELSDTKLTRLVSPYPFVPQSKEKREERCKEIIAIQSMGLVKRLKHTGCKNVVIGLSGGLDSTLALLITATAFDRLSLDKKGIHCVSMPCFGTTNRTKNNSELLAKAMNTSFKEIPIGEAVKLHLKDITHDGVTLDVTYENGQARERTQVLMNYSNLKGGFVIGTGDLSELALGWATYNGDHMSMYGVNCSIPKTLVRHLVAYFSSISKKEMADVLDDILDTPVSPELLPPKDGEISQCTEEIVGPYDLHDFFLYYILRFGFSPLKIYRLSVYAFEGKFEADFIKQWLKVFYKRFFSQQFKRSCLPDGPKVGSVTLSPRGDWRMPSDASFALWNKELETI